MAFLPRRRVPKGRVDEWRAVQGALQARFRTEPLAPLPRFVAGVDCAYSGSAGETSHAVAVVYDREQQQVVQVRAASQPCDVPYVPGYLSFREAPAVHAALDAISAEYGAILFDGQGIAHPRRCGLATHVGVERDVPSVGCAKSRLIGTHDEPGERAGEVAELIDRDERVGRVVRTRDRVKPLYVSVGHRVTLEDAVALVLACRTRYRLPEPTRQADRLVALAKRGERVNLG